MAFTVHQETKIYWNESGGGEPVLLIMGLGYTHEMWGRTRRVLDQHYRTIAFDNRGVGQSDVPKGPYSIRAMAGDAEAVLRAAGVDKAHVFGISMGGMIAQEFALQYPERVQSLILGCTSFGGPHAVPAAPKVLATLMARAKMTPEEGSEAMVPYIYDANTPRARIDEDLAVRRKTFPTAEGYLAQVQGVMSWSCYDRLGSIMAPTLVIHGETDELVPPQNGRILGERIPGAKLVMLRNASHIFPTDAPEQTFDALLAFLAAHQMAGASTV